MRKLKVIQVGICHEHAWGKYHSLKKMPELFDLAGVVDERSFCHTPVYIPYISLLEKERVLTLDEALNYPGLDAVLIEVPNLDLVPVAMMFAKKGIPMHVDKPCGETLAPYTISKSNIDKMRKVCYIILSTPIGDGIDGKNIEYPGA